MLVDTSFVESQSLAGASTARPKTATQLNHTSGLKKGFITFLDEVFRRDSDVRSTTNVTPHKVITTQACCAGLAHEHALPAPNLSAQQPNMSDTT